VSRCFHADVADGVLHGRLSDPELARALKHAAGCANCRRTLAAAGRPTADAIMNSDGGQAMEAIQDRLAAWRAARRAPLMPAFPWHKGHEVDHYVITRSVGGTEDGVIYEAFDPEREERVVVKQLDLHIDDPATPALIGWARELCRFSHPGVLQMRSVGVHAGFVYVVYELVKGAPLSQTGGDDPHAVIALFAEAARGLAAAHEAGIVHGWFWAASCVVGRDGRVRVLDFGIGEARVHRAARAAARHDDWTVASDQISSEDSFVGFVPTRRRRHPTSGEFEALVLAAGPTSLGPRIYAAPELVLGAPPSAATDQFALCAALFHRLYGHPPIDGDTIALWLRGLLQGPAIDPPTRAGVPASVRAARRRGLPRDPAARFDRMADLAAALDRRPRMAHMSGRRTLGAIAAGIGLAAVSLAVIGAVHRSPATAPAAGRCERPLAGWDALTTASQLDRSLAGGAADAAQVLRARLDAWLASWRAATHGFCASPDGPPAACAARARTAAADLLALVDDAPESLPRAAAATEALPVPAQCASPAPSPATAPAGAVEADVRRRLGMLDAADQRTASPASDPAERSYQAVVRGHTAADRGDVIEARRLFETATFEAAAARQPELSATAAVERLALSCSAPERAVWSGYLTAELALGSHAQAQTAYRGALARSLACEGKLAEAIALRRDIAVALHGEPTAEAAEAALELAQAQVAHGDVAGAEPAAREAAATYARIWGAHHPEAQAARLTIAETQLGSPAAVASAAAEIDRVVAELADHKEPDAIRARALVLQARLAEARGDREAAIGLVGRAIQEYEAALGGTHPALAAAVLAAADLQLAAGRDPDAEAHYRQVAAIFDTLGQSESAALAHARAGILLAHWGAHPPADAADTLSWGLAPTGDAIDPAVAGWVADQLGHRAAARGDLTAALAHSRAAAAAWQQSGDARGLAAAQTEAALLAARLHTPDARAQLEQALPIAPAAARPHVQAALAQLLWPTQRDRAHALARAALAQLPDDSPDAAELTRWLGRRDGR
jgi:tetratricopeptide (TPR) repeat protein